MPRRLAPSIALMLPTLAGLLVAVPAAAQEASPPATTTDAFAEIEAEYRELSTYLMKRRGVGEGERQDLLALRTRLDQFALAHPDDPRPIAIDLQVALWLGEEDRVDAAFNRLIDLQPGNAAIRRRWAQAMMQANRWDEVVVVLDDATITAVPEALVDRARALMNLNRFADALSLLPANDAAAPAIASQVTALRGQLEPLLESWLAEEALVASEAEANTLPRVRLETSKGPIVLELFEDQAPYTVANFIELVGSGFYDGTTFHRVIPSFMAQGGDPNTKPGGSGAAGSGGPGYTIPDEGLRADKRKHFAARLAMAKPGDPANPGKSKPNSAGSQFYLTVVPTPHLDAEYTVFGRIIEGDAASRALRMDDVLLSATILRKRDHEYVPVKLGASTPATGTTPTSDTSASSTSPDATSTPSGDAGTSPSGAGG
ncbi:MAG: hypothetical protein FJ257_10455 [Phycisphaerae bacterium]|nr:hypothetical protein [Phycisphaerae bacterium]